MKWVKTVTNFIFPFTLFYCIKGLDCFVTIKRFLILKPNYIFLYEDSANAKTIIACFRRNFSILPCRLKSAKTCLPAWSIKAWCEISQQECDYWCWPGKFEGAVDWGRHEAAVSSGKLPASGLYCWAGACFRKAKPKTGRNIQFVIPEGHWLCLRSSIRPVSHSRRPYNPRQFPTGFTHPSLRFGPKPQKIALTPSYRLRPKQRLPTSPHHRRRQYRKLLPILRSILQPAPQGHLKEPDNIPEPAPALDHKDDADL